MLAEGVLDYVVVSGLAILNGSVLEEQAGTGLLILILILINNRI